MRQRVQQCGSERSSVAMHMVVGVCLSLLIKLFVFNYIKLNSSLAMLDERNQILFSIKLISYCFIFKNYF